MVLLAWLVCSMFLAAAIGQMVRAIRNQSESGDEFVGALLAYAAPIPGAIVMGLAVFGFTPPLLLVPGVVYMYILLLTRRQPLLLLGYFIDRIDRKVSDRYSARLIGLILATVVVGGILKVSIFH